MSTKGCSGFFLFCLNLELFAKIKNTWFPQTRYFTFLLIIQDLNKIKKIQNTLLSTLLSRKCVQKILKSVEVGARQGFKFFRQITWFLGNNRALS